MEKTISYLQQKINERAHNKLCDFLHKQYTEMCKYMAWDGNQGEHPERETILSFKVTGYTSYSNSNPVYEVVGERAKGIYDFLLPKYIEDETNIILNNADMAAQNDFTNA
jgi:hypothetical protein